MRTDERDSRLDGRDIDTHAHERHSAAVLEHAPPDRLSDIRERSPSELRSADKPLNEKEKSVGEEKPLTPEEKKDRFEQQKEQFREALDKGAAKRMKEVASQMDFKTERSTAVFYSEKSYISDEQAREYQAQHERGEHEWNSLKPTDDGRWTVDNRERAEAFCAKERENGANWTTIEQTEAGRFLDEQKLFDKLDDKSAREVWGVASDRYARSASGSAIVFETNATSERSTWRKEWDVLKEDRPDNEITNVISDSPRLDQGGQEFDRHKTDLRA